MTGTELVATHDKTLPAGEAMISQQFVTMRVENQLFGIPVLLVQDVLKKQHITHVPLSPPEILGSMNLRGRIVTVVDMRTRLGLPRLEDDKYVMSVVVEHKDELYSLVVDKVGEVLTLSMADFEHSPANLDDKWKQVSMGVYRLKETIMIVLDIEHLLNF